MATKSDDATTAPPEIAVAPETKQTEVPTSDSTPQDPVTEIPESVPTAPTAPTEELKNPKPSEKKVQDSTAVVADQAVPPPYTKEDTTPSSSSPVWPETPADHPLSKFFDQIEELTKETGHHEVYGITLSPTNAFYTKLILQKFLRANQGDLEKAKQQLRETLEWRKQFDPIKAACETFDRSRFDGLGYILHVEDVPESANKSDVVTFNIYGAVKDNKKTFGNLDAFLRWRVGLMERSVQHLNLSSATQPIPDFGAGPDPYQGYQVHDYLRVSFLRQDPLVKEATKKTIEILGRCYPETLSRKFFLNVPVVMGWMYQAAKLLVSKETAKKFTVLSYGSALAGELGKGLPKEYGGDKGALSEVGEAMKLGDE